MRVIKLVYSNSKVGRFHRENGLLNQDSIKCLQTEDLVLGVLADGVSAAQNGGEGAAITTETVAKFLLNNGKKLFCLSEEHLKTAVLNEVLSALKEKAVGDDVEQFASTLVFSLFQKSQNRLMLFTLGDSKIYLLSSDGCKPFAENLLKELKFTTSKDAFKSAELKIVSAEDIKGVMLCSDGAWRTMYSNGVMLPSLFTAGKTFELDAFKEHFEKQDCYDDMSVIMFCDA